MLLAWLMFERRYFPNKLCVQILRKKFNLIYKPKQIRYGTSSNLHVRLPFVYMEHCPGCFGKRATLAPRNIGKTTVD